MKELVRSLLVLIVMSLLTGALYPLVVTGLAKAGFPRQARGSLLMTGDTIIGSAIIGQNFSSPRYFRGRPSAIEKAYDAGNSGGSNFGPSNAKFLEEVGRRVETVRKDNGLERTASVPADLVLASASGLDPHISVEAAMIQVKRVAKARGVPEPDVQVLVERFIEMPLFGFLGEKRINVLRLNLALDELSRRRIQSGESKPNKRG
ncbi:MAG: potassium-transporting ATPase subunit KdpC [Proteobacteria bacterium]|nr:potassium-transporting ATPase subunit KdpC [Pseudomonadota bacterium]